MFNVHSLVILTPSVVDAASSKGKSFHFGFCSKIMVDLWLQWLNYSNHGFLDLFIVKPSLIFIRDGLFWHITSSTGSSFWNKTVSHSKYSTEWVCAKKRKVSSILEMNNQRTCWFQNVIYLITNKMILWKSIAIYSELTALTCENYNIVLIITIPVSIHTTRPYLTLRIKYDC